MRFLLVTMLMVSMSAFTQEEQSREPAPGVTELTVIKVKANYLGNYMDGIEKTWVASNQIAKDMGKIVDYGVYVGNNNYVYLTCLLYTSPSPRDGLLSRMPSSA